MKRWARRFRGYLIVLPLALVVGYGFHGYQWWTGKDGIPSRPTDVPKGEARQLGPITVKLVGISKKQPEASEPGGLNSNVPQDAVVVVAKFRGRIDDPKAAKKIFCETGVENGAGWEWDSEFLNEPYLPKDAAKNCNGKRLDDSFKDVYPKKGEWYDFYNGYYVPKKHAKDLMPILGHYPEYPSYLRFSG